MRSTTCARRSDKSRLLPGRPVVEAYPEMMTLRRPFLIEPSTEGDRPSNQSPIALSWPSVSSSFPILNETSGAWMGFGGVRRRFTVNERVIPPAKFDVPCTGADAEIGPTPTPPPVVWLPEEETVALKVTIPPPLLVLPPTLTESVAP